MYLFLFIFRKVVKSGYIKPLHVLAHFVIYHFHPCLQNWYSKDSIQSIHQLIWNTWGSGEPCHHEWCSIFFANFTMGTIWVMHGRKVMIWYIQRWTNLSWLLFFVQSSPEKSFTKLYPWYNLVVGVLEIALSPLELGPLCSRRDWQKKSPLGFLI